MTRDEARGYSALKELPRYIAPRSYWIGSGGKLGRKLYALEEKRSAIIGEIAKVWAQIAEVDESEYWTRSLPQALHDTLDAYETATGIVAAEAYLKRHGWTVLRPKGEVPEFDISDEPLSRQVVDNVRGLEVQEVRDLTTGPND